MKIITPLSLLICFTVFTVFTTTAQKTNKKSIITGADQTEKYIGDLQGKRVAILANPTTIIGKKHLVDSLMKRGINIVKVFGPEHGFRGNASNGAEVADEKDPATGIK